MSELPERVAAMRQVVGNVDYCVDRSIDVSFVV